MELVGELTVDPFVLDIELHVGAATFDGVELHGVELAIHVEPAEWSLSLAGTATIEGSTISVTGTVDAGAGGANLALTGHLDKIQLGGAELSDLTLSLEFTTLPPTVAVTLAGNLAMGPNTAAVDLTLTYLGGALVAADGSFSTSFDVEDVEVDGEFTFGFVPSAEAQITADVVVAVDGYQLTDATGRVNRNGLELAGDLAIPGVVDAHLSGALVWEAPGSDPIQVQDLDGQLACRTTRRLLLLGHRHRRRRRRVPDHRAAAIRFR